jgi:hypothetical protein
MTERTVTEQQVIDAMNKHSNLSNVYSELFPADSPKVGELIFGLYRNPAFGEWGPFIRFASDGGVVIRNGLDGETYYDNYRQLTPDERGEV